MNIENRQIMTLSEKIEWLSVLNNGYVKPDMNKDVRSNTGTIRDTKHFEPYIALILKDLCECAGYDDCPQEDPFTKSKTKNRNING